MFLALNLIRSENWDCDDLSMTFVISLVSLSITVSVNGPFILQKSTFPSSS